MSDITFVPGAKAEVRGKGRDTMAIISVAIIIVGFVVLLAFL
jgi:hypothetical protein